MTTATEHRVRPPRSIITITIADPADLTEEQCADFKRLIPSHPGDTGIRFAVAGKLLALPEVWQVKIAPPFLTALKGVAGHSWTWAIKPVAPERAARRPPPARRPS